MYQTVWCPTSDTNQWLVNITFHLRSSWQQCLHFVKEKNFSRLWSSGLRAAHTLLYFFSEENSMCVCQCPVSHAWPYTHPYTNRTQILLASQPVFSPCCAWSGVFPSSAEHREMAVVPCSLVFHPAFSILSPRTPLRRQLHSDKLF